VAMAMKEVVVMTVIVPRIEMIVLFWKIHGFELDKKKEKKKKERGAKQQGWKMKNEK